MGECGYDQCFVPPERHDECAAAPISKCWGGLGHQHAKKRSAGGRRCDVMLCSGHHQCIDAGHRYEGLRLANGIDVQANGRRVYVIWDRDDAPESIDPLVRVELEVKE